jgi:hypothetical protein
MGNQPARISIASVTVLVRNYDEAIEFFTRALRFRVIEDTPLGAGKRWVRVAPDEGGAALLLARAIGPLQERAIGDQSGVAENAASDGVACGRCRDVPRKICALCSIRSLPDSSPCSTCADCVLPMLCGRPPQERIPQRAT